MTGRLCLRSSLAFWRVVHNKQFFSKRLGAQMYDDINGIFCYALSRCGACTLDILIRKISLDPIGLHGQGAIENYIPKFQVATMSLEVA